MSLLMLHDRTMNANNLRAGRRERRLADPIEGAAQPRSSLLVIAGVSVAIVGAVLAVAAGLDHEVAMIFGLGLFIAGTVIGLTFAGPVPSRLTPYRGPDDRLSDGTGSRRASGPGGFHDSRPSMQLGPDPEQVIGRYTGART